VSNEVRLIGTSQVIANIDKIEKQVLAHANILVQEAILETAFQAKWDAPVDMGGLMQSISVTYQKSKLEGTVSVNAPYAPYVEFGTGGLVEIPQGFEELAAKFKGRGVKKVNLPARPFLIPAALKEGEILQEQLAKLIQ